jgi:hypothetical protein
MLVLFKNRDKLLGLSFLYPDDREELLKRLVRMIRELPAECEAEVTRDHRWFDELSDAEREKYGLVRGALSPRVTALSTPKQLMAALSPSDMNRCDIRLGKLGIIPVEGCLEVDLAELLGQS